jgi:hypothetical protein
MKTSEIIDRLEWIRDNELNYTLEEEMEALTHAIEHMKRFQWRPISEAPRDGTHILWKGGKDMCVIYWPIYKECFDGGCWTHLPDAPEVEG